VQTLLDRASPFLEVGATAAYGMYDDRAPGAGLITGIGSVSGRDCMVVCNDTTVMGGTYANMSAEGIAQVAVVMGSCTAGGAYVPAMSDESIIVREQGTIFLGGPPLVKAATGEVVSAEDLGGGDVHTRLSGVADYLAENDDHALAIARDVISHLDAATTASLKRQTPEAPLYDSGEIEGIVPMDKRQPFDEHQWLYGGFKVRIRRYSQKRGKACQRGCHNTSTQDHDGHWR